jgi:hypothetical protein
VTFSSLGARTSAVVEKVFKRPGFLNGVAGSFLLEATRTGFITRPD